MSCVDDAVPITKDPSHEEIRAQLEQILKSLAFRNAESNRALLKFLAISMLERGGEHLKESEIAVSVFRRSAQSFDPQSDSVVRVQMARLRAKLQEYYQAEGDQDPIQFEIPKGSYHLHAAIRPPSVPRIEEQNATPSWLDRVQQLRRSTAALLVAAVALLAAGAALEWLWQRSAGPPLPPRLSWFWKQVLPDQVPNLIVFSNPRLMGHLFDGTLRYYDESAAKDGQKIENLTYTGSGDVPAVSALTHLFDGLGKAIKVSSGATLSWAQAKESNLIFVGRPEQNPSLRMLPRLTEFNFRFRLGIMDTHPPPGRPANYSTTDLPYIHDWAIIAFVPGLSPDRTTFIMAGNTTYGSHAAADFVCDEKGVAALMERLHVKQGDKLPFFESLIEVRINRDVPVWTHLEFARIHPPGVTTWQPLAADEW